MIPIEEVTPTSPTSIKVVFGGVVGRYPGLMDPDSYLFTNDLDTLGVLALDERTVELQTTPQKADAIYELDVKVAEEAEED